MTARPGMDAPAHGVQPLEGRVVIVTGAARGLGRVLAHAMAMAMAGADVAVTARRTAALAATIAEIRRCGHRALPVELDLHERASIAPAIDSVVESLGRIDVLICNSGVAGPSVPTWSVTDKEWDETFAVNVTGAFACAQAAARHMLPSRRGVVLFIGSMTGKRPLLHRAPYAASKMALVGLCRTMALDLGPSKVRVNLLSPGFVEGERLDWVIDAQATAQSRPFAVVRDEMLAASPLHRFTTPEEVAHVAVFLASDLAAGISGEDINVSSGVVMH